MRRLLTEHPVKACCAIFGLLLALHAVETLVLRMDETFWGENFIHKLCGILVLWLVLRALQWKWRDIGFVRDGLARNTVLGLLFAAAVFVVAYAVEAVVLKHQGHGFRLDFFTTGFSLTGTTEIRRGVGYILLCAFFNIINVIMEEGVFRGLLYGIAKTERSAGFAIVMQAVLFGIWHVVTPLHHLIDGALDIGGFIGLSIGYMVLAGIMGIKWGLMYRMTGSLYMGMADHFFNNCIATNLLHVSTESGTDELLILRVLLAQMLSFAVVIALWRKRGKDRAAGT